MKKRNSYYKEVFGRPAMFKQIFLSLFLALSYFFRVPIEVITRQNMGERYFNILLTVVIGIALVYVPINYSKQYNDDIDWGRLFHYFTTWYIYTALYLYSSYKRWSEIRTYPSVWNLKRFSLSTGKPHPFFLGLNIGGKPLTPRFIGAVAEPGIFLALGLVLSYFQQPLGWFFVLCSIIYALGYTAAYYLADQFVMDKIDEMICNEDMRDIFVNDIGSKRGFEFSAKRPTNKAARQQLYDEYIDVENTNSREPQVMN